MKKSKLIALLLAAGLTISIGNSANAEIGYLNYQKVLDNYPAAQQAVKEIDAKGLELQQYMLEKEKQYKALDTPLKKQNFETQTASEFNAKQDALMKLRNDKEFMEQAIHFYQKADIGVDQAIKDGVKELYEDYKEVTVVEFDEDLDEIEME